MSSRLIEETMNSVIFIQAYFYLSLLLFQAKQNFFVQEKGKHRKNSAKKKENKEDGD